MNKKVKFKEKQIFYIYLVSVCTIYILRNTTRNNKRNVDKNKKNWNDEMQKDGNKSSATGKNSINSF